MFENLEIFRMSHAMAKHAGNRRALVAQNVANSDTPGYLAQRLPSFADAIESPLAIGRRSTRASHLFGDKTVQMQAKVSAERLDPSPNGNTVSVEREMLESVNVKREHDRALTIYKSSLKILRMSLGKG